MSAVALFVILTFTWLIIPVDVIDFEKSLYQRFETAEETKISDLFCGIEETDGQWSIGGYYSSKYGAVQGFNYVPTNSTVHDRLFRYLLRSGRINGITINSPLESSRKLEISILSPGKIDHPTTISRLETFRLYTIANWIMFGQRVKGYRFDAYKTATLDTHGAALVNPSKPYYAEGNSATPHIVFGRQIHIGNMRADADESDASTLFADIYLPPKNGTVTFNQNGNLAYTANAKFSGIDSFAYEVRDSLIYNGKVGNYTSTLVIVDSNSDPK